MKSNFTSAINEISALIHSIPVYCACPPPTILFFSIISIIPREKHIDNVLGVYGTIKLSIDNILFIFLKEILLQTPWYPAMSISDITVMMVDVAYLMPQ